MERINIETLAIAAFFIAVVLVLAQHGTDGRVYLDKKISVSIASPYEAYYRWEGFGLRGRTLVLFDSRLNANSEGRPLAPDNYVYKAIKGNIIRRVYHIIPGSEWHRVRQVLDTRPAVSPSESGYMTSIEGAPLFVSDLETFKRVWKGEEKAIVNINAPEWKDDERRQIYSLTDDGRLDYDILTIVQASDASSGL